MMMLYPPPPHPFSLSLCCFPHTHTDMHILLMGFHNKWILHSRDASHKSMVPDLLSLTRLLTHTQTKSQTDTLCSPEAFHLLINYCRQLF